MRRRRWINAWLAALVGLACLASAGCYAGHFFAWLFAPRHPMQTIKAEFPLKADRLVIVIYAGTEILFSDPTMPLEISRDLVNEILRNPDPRVKGIVHPVQVVRWQESNLEWPNMALVDIAKTFQADTILYVEVQRHTLVEDGSANLLRGRVRARVQVAQVAAERNPVYETTVETTFPEDQPIGEEERSQQVVRACTHLVFAKDVVNKFHDYEIEVRGGKP